MAQTHPPLYMMHKYWARKPANVVARYIEYYTNPGDVVLDPFVGSGVTIIEAARLGRLGIGIDLNPVACFIARMTLLPVELSELHLGFDRIKAAVKDDIYSCYQAPCSNPRCGKQATATHVVWKNDKFKAEKMFLLKVACPHCNQQTRRKPTDDDFQQYERVLRKPIPFFYPKGVHLHASAKRSVEFIHELFTHRALVSLSLFYIMPFRTRRAVIFNRS